MYRLCCRVNHQRRRSAHLHGQTGSCTSLLLIRPSRRTTPALVCWSQITSQSPVDSHSRWGKSLTPSPPLPPLPFPSPSTSASGQMEGPTYHQLLVTPNRSSSNFLCAGQGPNVGYVIHTHIPMWAIGYLMFSCRSGSWSGTCLHEGFATSSGLSRNVQDH